MEKHDRSLNILTGYDYGRMGEFIEKIVSHSLFDKLNYVGIELIVDKAWHTTDLSLNPKGSLKVFTAYMVWKIVNANKGDILVLEYPETFLHPQDQVAIALKIVEAANKGVQIFMVTQSDHVINRIRVAIKEKLIDKSEVIILSFGEKLVEIRADKNGELSEYPKGLLEEWSNQLFKLI